MKILKKIYLLAGIAIWHVFSNTACAEVWGIWHKPFNIETLAPIYEPDIWFTNCEQLNDKKANEIAQLIGLEKSIQISSKEYLSSSIRVILFSTEKIYHINQNFQFKKITSNSISYFKLYYQSELKGILESSFNQCKKISK